MIAEAATVMKLWPIIDKVISLFLLVIIVLITKWFTAKIKEMNVNQRELSDCIKSCKNAIRDLETQHAVMIERSNYQDRVLDKHDREFDKIYSKIDLVTKGTT